MMSANFEQLLRPYPIESGALLLALNLQFFEYSEGFSEHGIFHGIGNSKAMM